MKLSSDPIGHGGAGDATAYAELPDLPIDPVQTGNSQPAPAPGQTACWLVSVHPEPDSVSARARYAEIEGLATTLYDSVLGGERVALTRPDPRTLLGSGTCLRIAEEARAAGATLLVIDAPLTPSQTRNLEDATGLAIADREVVILGVFRRHAKTRAARVQVEVAQLQYLRPRIRGLGLDMDQQAGGVMQGKGAGETASELLARQLDDRLVRLRRLSAKLETQRAEQARRREDTSRIALVGYTNAGKTALMNALTGSTLSSRSQPFETLDTTARCLTRHGGTVVLHDTVGFIRDLPKRLLASFASTLAEVSEATLLVIVLDASDPEWPMHLEVTEHQLEALGVAHLPTHVVLNKADQLDSDARSACESAVQDLVSAPATVLSALDPVQVDAFRDALLHQVRALTQVTAEVFVPYDDAEAMSVLYGQVRIEKSEATEQGLCATVTGPPAAIARLATDGGGACNRS